MPTLEELKELQSLTLERKIQITQTRIMEWYLRYKGQVYISFSGGKDSTVLLDLARRCFPDIEAVFVDTGLEYPEIREFVKTHDNVTIIRPKMGFKDVIEKYGYPVISKEVAKCVYYANKGSGWAVKKLNGTYSKFCERFMRWEYIKDAPFVVSHMCCDEMKKKPIHAYERETGKRAVIGTMAYESNQRMQGWIKTGCNSFEENRPISKPMSFWTEQDVLHYLKRFNVPYCSVYGEIVPKSEFVGQLAMDDVPTDLVTTGCTRTGCMFCMFGVHLENEPNRFQRMRETHPKQYDYCIREENGLGLGKVLDFINVKY